MKSLDKTSGIGIYSYPFYSLLTKLTKNDKPVFGLVMPVPAL